MASLNKVRTVITSRILPLLTSSKAGWSTTFVCFVDFQWQKSKNPKIKIPHKAPFHEHVIVTSSDVKIDDISANITQYLANISVFFNEIYLRLATIKFTVIIASSYLRK